MPIPRTNPNNLRLHVQHLTQLDPKTKEASRTKNKNDRNKAHKSKPNIRLQAHRQFRLPMRLQRQRYFRRRPASGRVHSRRVSHEQ